MNASIWSGPDSPFFQPIQGFPVGTPFRAPLPEYGKGKVSKEFKEPLPTTDFSAIPYPMVGLDFQSGKRDQDLLSGIDSALPSLSPRAQEYYDFYTATSPLRLAEQEQQARLSSRLTREQLASLYPYLSAAGAESTARNLAASKEFGVFKEQLPSSVQNIMASKQAQVSSAANAEAARQQATALQQQAAKQFAGSFAGKYIQAA